MNETSLEVIQGTLDVLILKSLSWGPLHGYGVVDSIQSRCGDSLRVEEGALYPALHRLERKGWIDGEWGVSENNRRARYYRLTARGRQQLKSETHQWLRYAAALVRMLEAV